MVHARGGLSLLAQGDLSAGSYRGQKPPGGCQGRSRWLGPMQRKGVTSRREAGRRARAYHPSTARRQTCRRTGGEAWRYCRSGGPCSSSATHPLCNPPGRVGILVTGCSRLLSPYSTPRAEPNPRIERLENKTPFGPVFPSPRRKW